MSKALWCGIVVVVVLFSAGSTVTAQSTNWVIKRISAEAGYTEVEFENDVDVCSGADAAWKRKPRFATSSSRHDTWLKLLLSAYLAGKSVNIVAGPSSGLCVLTQVTVE